MKEKHIEEMANDLAQHCPDLVQNCCGASSCVDCLTRFLYNAGYRKQRDLYYFEEGKLPVLIETSENKQREGEWAFATHHYFDDYGDLKVYATASCSECKKAYPFNPSVASEFVERPENLSGYEDWNINIEPIKAEVLKRAKANKSLYPFCPNCGAKMKGENNG